MNINKNWKYLMTSNIAKYFFQKKAKEKKTDLMELIWRVCLHLCQASLIITKICIYRKFKWNDNEQNYNGYVTSIASNNSIFNVLKKRRKNSNQNTSGWGMIHIHYIPFDWIELTNSHFNLEIFTLACLVVHIIFDFVRIGRSCWVETNRKMLYG